MTHLQIKIHETPTQERERAQRRSSLPLDDVEWNTWDVLEPVAVRALAAVRRTGGKRGGDISHYQGEPDFIALSRSLEYLYLKATEHTTFKDKTYHRNREMGRRSGLRTGPYHFARPGSVAFAIEQVKHMRKFTGPLVPGDLFPAQDIEVPGFTPAVVRALMEETKQQYQVPTATCYIATSIVLQSGMKEVLVGYLPWIPRYGGEPAVPYLMWQDTDKFPVPGVGAIDGNLTWHLPNFIIKQADKPPATWGQYNKPMVGGFWVE